MKRKIKSTLHFLYDITSFAEYTYIIYDYFSIIFSNLTLYTNAE